MISISALQQKEQSLQRAWVKYQTHPDFESFVEFSLLLNNLTDSLTHPSWSGLRYVCHRLEQQSLALFDNPDNHPISAQKMADIQQQIGRLGKLLRHYSDKQEISQERRIHQESGGDLTPKIMDGANQVFLIGEEGPHWQELASQFSYFGISVHVLKEDILQLDHSTLGVYLVDFGEQQSSRCLDMLKQLRKHIPMARIVAIGMPDDFMLINQALQTGADHCMTRSVTLQQILNQILEHKDSTEQDSYRVLIVEDSQTAAHAINRSLEEHGIITRILPDPLQSLPNIRQFQPDLILMDMYMPSCTGVEAARVIRQHDEFLSIPIVYLSGETNIALQVEALRLGGDQFLTKPFNPVLINAIIKSKIDRYRALRRSMQNDSLTGLLNHISSKQALATALGNLPDNDNLTIAMLDIDHFKDVNDTHGHPAGDRVIRSLAWLLKQRLRHSDIIGRYGGEEFVVGLVHTHLDGAKEILNRIREDFSCIVFRGTDTFKVTFSAGAVTCTNHSVGNLEMLLKTADNALYKAKRQGRNRVVLTRQ
ncbi:MAG: diguanylate cyclase [Zoogloeaceae bacterium]|jgi:diguanylate cyclase (GGDEF)-like protein|nr:diguanylate cyclase [Zoogloeaceae bacterium]